MKEKTLEEIKKCQDFMLLLEESTDESDRSELYLQVRIIKQGRIQNHFLELLQLRQGDALTIIDFFEKNVVDLKRTRFAGMDGCILIAAEHNGESEKLHLASYICVVVTIVLRYVLQI